MKVRRTRTLLWIVNICCFLMLVGGMCMVYHYVGNAFYRVAIQRGNYEDTMQFASQVENDLQNAINYARLSHRFESGGELDLDRVAVRGVDENQAEVEYTLQNALDYGRSIGMVFDSDHRLIVRKPGKAEGEEIQPKTGTEKSEENAAPPLNGDYPATLTEIDTNENGILDEKATLLSLLYQLSEYYELQDHLGINGRKTNFYYQMVWTNQDGDPVLSANREDSFGQSRLEELGAYYVLESSREEALTSFSEPQAEILRSALERAGVLSQKSYEVRIAVDCTYPEKDVYRRNQATFMQFRRILRVLQIFGIVLAIGVVSSFVGLIVVKPVRSRAQSWYTEFIMIAVIGAGLLMYWGISELKYGFLARSTLDIISGVGLFVLAYFPLAIGGVTLIHCLLQPDVMEHFLFWQAIRGVRESYANRNDRWRSGRMVLLILMYQVWNLGLALAVGLTFRRIPPLSAVLFTILVMINVAYLVYNSRQNSQQRKVFDRVATLAAGDVGRKLDVESMQGEVKRIAQTVNALDESLEKAVQERTRDERMKTDLIANVSHDLRTPLTSIINYVDLIKREHIENPRVQEYLRVLTEKANRLVTLMEALMDASRASSGNLKISWERIDMVQMVLQVYGEFQEQMEEKGLIPVVHLVDPPAVILADGKILWRVLDNLYGNLLKYAKPGTQVSIELQETAHSLIYTMKNVSANPLTFTSDELIERFTRGDVARTTPGSGLGLSIAKSMTEQLHGKFEVISDEEMFRVRLVFPLAEM